MARPGRKNPPEARPAPRTPPPERTGLEAAYLGSLARAAHEVVITLRGGRTVRGRIRSFDREVCLIDTGEGRTEVLRKSEIRHLAEC
jgi:small nuclear ribonucleoprotein (snRNP)-like protein